MSKSSRSPKSDPRRALGAHGEALAAVWYEERGFAVVDRNWRRREGEIDLVLQRDRLVVICEVKARSSTRFGMPFEAVTRAKQLRLRRLGAMWLVERGLRGVDLRFDVASVSGITVDVI
ncbi:MAG TPA: YraN family protein, partial [Acidimicrobiales bacterium]|nr:YraN family protein [Acidimicrobiales bacterium]